MLLNNLQDIINILKEKSDTWKIQLTIAINFVSYKNNDEQCVMHSKSNNIEMIINDNFQKNSISSF